MPDGAGCRVRRTGQEAVLLSRVVHHAWRSSDEEALEDETQNDDGDEDVECELSGSQFNRAQQQHTWAGACVNLDVPTDR